MKHDFRSDLQEIMAMTDSGQPFGFVRLGDGERALLDGQSMTICKPCEQWSSPHAEMRACLQRILRYKPCPRAPASLYVGISCPCCDPESHEFYLKEAGCHSECLTFANLFANGNYDIALPWLRDLMARSFVISSAWGSDMRIAMNWSAGDLGHQCDEAISRLEAVRRPILVAAGPLGKAIILRYVSSILRAPILDVGSALDPILHGQATRKYHDPTHPNRKKICVWSSPA